jgi:phosphoribosyl-AMP cyclohydrolase
VLSVVHSQPPDRLRPEDLTKPAGYTNKGWDLRGFVPRIPAGSAVSVITFCGIIMIDFRKGNGLVPAIVQDDDTGQVLMLAYMNKEAWEKTLATGKAHYWSRSRQKLWLKGATSGHLQEVRAVYLDCDLDTVLLRVHQVGGAACHEGYASCFYRKVEQGELKVVGSRVFDPEEVYGS